MSTPASHLTWPEHLARQEGALGSNGLEGVAHMAVLGSIFPPSPRALSVRVGSLGVQTLCRFGFLGVYVVP